MFGLGYLTDRIRETDVKGGECTTTSSSEPPTNPILPFNFLDDCARQISLIKQEAALCSRGNSIKFSRQTFRRLNLSSSYFYIPGVGIFCQLHSKDFIRSDGIEIIGNKAPYDPNPSRWHKIGFIGAGASKRVYEIKPIEMEEGIPIRSWVRIVNINPRFQFSQKFLNTLPLLRECKEINQLIHLRYFKRSTVKELFLSIMMDKQDLFSIYKEIISQSVKFDLARQMTRAVAYLHDKGFIHGDLKFDNFLVHQKGNSYEVQLGDLDSVVKVYAGLRVLSGTPFWIDPLHQFSPAHYSTLFSGDVFSLGVCFYLLFTGINYYFYGIKEVEELGKKRIQIDPNRPQTREDFERNGFYPEPKDKTGILYLIWQMCDPIPINRPKIPEVLSRLEIIISEQPAD